MKIKKKDRQTRNLVRKLAHKWAYRLGLNLWDCTFYYVVEPEEIVREFARDNEINTVLARAYSNWTYQTVKIYFNIPAMGMLDRLHIERTVVHELIHPLVNEMQAEGIDHEERVVTGLTNAFMWTKKDLLK